MEPHDCNWHDDLRRCINERCPLHRAMRRLASNLEIAGALCASFRAGDNFGFHMGSDESQCTCQWAPGHGTPYKGWTRCEQDPFDEIEDYEDRSGYGLDGDEPNV